MSLFGPKVANFCTYCKKEGHRYCKCGKRPNNTLACTFQAQSSQAPQLGNAIPNARGPRFVQPNSQSRKTTSTKRSRVQVDSRPSSPENGLVKANNPPTPAITGPTAQKKSGNKGKSKQAPPKAPVKTLMPPSTKAQGKAPAAEEGILNKPVTMTFVLPLPPATLIAPPGVHPFTPRNCFRGHFDREEGREFQGHWNLNVKVRGQRHTGRRYGQLHR
ncbi:hypothetical protein EV175_000742 [Coemansia sp. RSA 1933]|nr:hypothetical protein EV175_000742 [Coemansia sp. RSA 1933]